MPGRANLYSTKSKPPWETAFSIFWETSTALADSNKLRSESRKKSKQDEPEWLKTNWIERIVGEDLKWELDSFDVLWLLINMYWKTKVQLRGKTVRNFTSKPEKNW